MPPKTIAPDIKLQSFSCPRCGALADQTWYLAYARRTEKGEPPFVSDEEIYERVKEYKEHDDALKEMHDNFLKEIERDKSGDVRLKDIESVYCGDEIINISASKCYSCSQITIWRHKSILYPPSRYEAEPNPDLPQNIRDDFEEARAVLDLSPRSAAALLRLCIQKICVHLDKPGKNINDDIADLVKDGLDSRIQKALDIVRVVGNEAVHPGTMDLKDDRATAAKLFELVNLIAHNMITQPKEISTLYDSLPEDKRLAIEKRDGKPNESKS